MTKFLKLFLKIRLTSSEKLFILALVGYGIYLLFLQAFFKDFAEFAKQIFALTALFYSLWLIGWFIYLVIVFAISYWEKIEYSTTHPLTRLIDWFRRDDR